MKDIAISYDLTYAVGFFMALAGMWFKELWWVFGGVLIFLMPCTEYIIAQEKKKAIPKAPFINRECVGLPPINELM